MLLQNGAYLKQSTNNGENAITLCMKYTNTKGRFNIIKPIIEYSILQGIKIDIVEYECELELDTNLLRELLFYEVFNDEMLRLIFKDIGAEKASFYANQELDHFCTVVEDGVEDDDFIEISIPKIELLLEFGANINNVTSIIHNMQNPANKNRMLSILLQSLQNVKERYKKQLDENEIMKEALLASPINGLVGHILGYVNCSN